MFFCEHCWGLTFSFVKNPPKSPHDFKDSRGTRICWCQKHLFWRLEFLRNSRMPFNLQRWWQNLAPSLQRTFSLNVGVFFSNICDKWTQMALEDLAVEISNFKSSWWQGWSLTWGFPGFFKSDLGGKRKLSRNQALPRTTGSLCGGTTLDSSGCSAGRAGSKQMLLRVEKLGKVGMEDFTTKFRGHGRRFWCAQSWRFPCPCLQLLMIWQVRDGTRSHVTENVYEYFFKDG